MTKIANAIEDIAAASTQPTKHQQMIELLSRDGGTTLDEMSTSMNWRTNSTRAYLTGLKKRGFELTSSKVDSVRFHRITKAPAS